MSVHSVGTHSAAMHILPLTAAPGKPPAEEAAQSDAADHAQTAFTQFDSGS